MEEREGQVEEGEEEDIEGARPRSCLIGSILTSSYLLIQPCDERPSVVTQPQ